MSEVRGDAVEVVRLTRKIAYSYPYALYTYEAGGCGSDCIANSTGLSRHCVVARSKISRVLNDRIKNDRRDTVSLARLLRADELSPVSVPDEGHEAMRDLLRARHCAREDLRKVRQQIRSFLLSHRHHYQGLPWKKMHMVCSGRHQFRPPGQQIAFQGYLSSATHTLAQRDELKGQIFELLPNLSMRPVSLCCSRFAASRRDEKESSADDG